MDIEGIYLKLIAVAESRNGKPLTKSHRKEGYESHHIMPRSVGGNDRPYNLVFLTPREHYTAHHLLARLYGGGLTHAFHKMSLPNQGNTSRNYTVTARQYQTAKILFTDFMRNRVVNEVTREKLRQHNLGKVVSDETREKLSKLFKGRIISQEQREKISAAKKGKPKTEEHKAIINKQSTCPHCGKTGKHANMIRYHFDNCTLITGEKRTNSFKGKVWPEITCPHCNKVGKGSSMYRHHFDNCHLLRGVPDSKDIVSCPHCGKSGTWANVKRFHFDNCKHKPS
ncbi:HNH endonuclease [Salmonella enterica]|nr:HNH endonuclease [Salmonella enterica]EIL8050628.1 HNH endonuclease [Salmonella enterica]